MTLSTRSNTIPIDPSDLKEIVSSWRITEEFQVATAALLVYDAVITLDKEAKYFWKIPRRPIHFIYFLNRYIGIFGAFATIYHDSLSVTLPLCVFSGWAQNTANWITVISIDYILMIRVLALYSQDRALSMFLKILLALEAVFIFVILIYKAITDHFGIPTFADISICATMTPSIWQLGLAKWLVPSMYGTLLMILALRKAAEYWRMSAGFKGFTLVRVLIEDQVIYFALAIFCSVFSILPYKLQTSNFFLAGILAQLGNPSLLSLLGSRMLFNLKEAGEQGHNEGTSYRTPPSTVSEMDFAEPADPQRYNESDMQHDGSEQMA